MFVSRRQQMPVWGCGVLLIIFNDKSPNINELIMPIFMIYKKR